ncbi:DUF2461 domain-containing protein [Tenacibaculum sp. IB213877]|uniref:DUF2461 domain-containing protein n=1 Tax=Tenacibaculum sp. IB213877 TaxID=3097351 RepID=UPI002A5AD465|nr:DUF2461 domain-containing protein [Tenacibaculum sp. IB213877]MDY0779539.1 DUF2461 domain-containing protein [Tenacibaculum sp. IB213877]
MQLEKSTLQFLLELKENNTREWFTEHKADFTKAQDNAKAVYAAIQVNLNKHDEVDKHKLFRIYRDVRFSKDKTPYKSHFGGSFHRKKPELRGGYYLHIAPGDSFLAGGFWEPNKEDLFRIRKELEMDASEIRDILKDKEFIKHFGGKFEGDELKTAPKGFDKDHPDIDLIRKKAYVAIKRYSDKEVLAPDFLDEVDIAFKALRPFFNLMSDILTTNLNGESIL